MTPATRWISVGALPLELVVVMVNEWGTAPRLAAGEQLSPYPDFDALIATCGLDSAATANPARDDEVTAVADALYPIFAAPDEDTVVTRLNDLLDITGAHPRLTRDGRILVEAWAAETSRQLLSAAALSLYRQLLDWGGAQRLGICTAARCTDVYVDSSSAGHKKFCSVRCQNRKRVAAFRARHGRPKGA
jgi:predicted RNA-binding Zn ribbon-like protein